jgi:hypothetical protein
MIDMGSRRFSKRPHDIGLIQDRYAALKEHVSVAERILVHARKFQIMLS